MLIVLDCGGCVVVGVDVGLLGCRCLRWRSCSKLFVDVACWLLAFLTEMKGESGIMPVRARLNPPRVVALLLLLLLLSHHPATCCMQPSASRCSTLVSGDSPCGESWEWAGAVERKWGSVEKISSGGAPSPLPVERWVRALCYRFGEQDCRFSGPTLPTCHMYGPTAHSPPLRIAGGRNENTSSATWSSRQL